MRRKNVFIACFSILLIIIIGIALADLNYRKVAEACFQDHCFDVELAKTLEEKSRGLMFREGLDPGRGMLFIFEEEGEYSFWMKNVLIPLDIIWIDKDNLVVFISENTQPCREAVCQSIKPGKNAKYVLEINGGVSKEINLSRGDKINLIYKYVHLIPEIRF